MADRGFDYQACLPYKTETQEEVLQQLNTIVSKLDQLYAAGEFQHYEYGTSYALEVWAQMRLLNSWIKCKHTMPLEVRVKLTRMFAQACFEAVEPVLVVRYGAECCSLWKSKRARKQLIGQSDIIVWETLIRVVRNLVLLSSSANANDVNGSSFEQLNSLVFTEMVKHGNPTKIALTIARLFRCTMQYSEAIKDQLFNDILSFLGPRTHDPKDTLVMEAFTSLIPTGDIVSAQKFIPLLFDLRHKVSETLFYQCVLPVIAEFSELHYRQIMEFSKSSPGNLPFLSDEQLDLCFQAALYAFDIPLMSAQATQSKKVLMRQALPTLAMSGSGSRLLKSTGNKYNSKAHAVNSAAFAKLVIYNTSLHDQRCINRLESLINAVISFCHPSNAGSWSTLIMVTLGALALEMSVRINSIGDVEQQIIDKFVLLLRPVILMGVHNHIPFVVTGSLDILRNLALWSPDLICPLILSEVYPTLQHGLHQSNRLVSSIAVLSSLAVPLAKIPQYKMHLTTLMELSLPNLDTNDTKRCLLTLDFFQALASVASFEDLSDPSSIALATQILPECVHALEEKGGNEILSLDTETIETVVRGTSAAYPEILSFYMRRIFDLLESTSEPRLGSASAASIMRVLLACSGSIFERLLDIALDEISNPQQQNHDSFAQVCGAFVRANCAVAFPKMWKLLSSNIKEEIAENQAGSGRVALPKDSNLLRNLSVLNMSLLAANANVILAFKDELRNLLILIRKNTAQSVVYTAANTVHHTIVALTAYSVILPSPEAFSSLPVSANGKKINLSHKSVDYLNMNWNVPSDESKHFAVSLFTEHVDYSEQMIVENIASVSKSIQSEDAVTNSLIFIRTAIGAIATLSEDETVSVYRSKILKLVTSIYEKLSKDNVACLKEVLFVSKVWACDVRYERTSRLDQHLGTLYNYEKRPFSVRGAQKRHLPPAILARRAQLYHHQRMSTLTQHRAADEGTVDLIMNILINACFSAYPAVRRNALSALYSPLKIFNDPGLYTQVYDNVLTKLSELLVSEEFEKVEGGLALLRYRSFGVQTVARNPSFIRRFYDVCGGAASADYRHLSTLATLVYFSLLADICRLGMGCDRAKNPTIDNSKVQPAAKSYIDDLVKYLLSEPLNKLHWREALFSSSTLLAISQNPQLDLNEEVLKMFINGSLIDHPDVRSVSTFGTLTIAQSIFRHEILGKGNSSKCSSDTRLIAPGGFSHDSSAPENDWSSFYTQTFSHSFKAPKSQLPQTSFAAPIGSQGWAISPSEGLMRSPTGPLDLSNAFRSESLLRTFGPTKLTNLLESLIKIRKVEPRIEQDTFSHAFTVHFRDLIVFGTSCGSLSVVLDATKEIQTAKDLTDKNWHRVSAELFCSQLLALPVLSKPDQNTLLEESLSILQLAYDNWSPETLGYWLSAISYSLRQIDYRRLLSIIEFIQSQAQPLNAPEGGGIKLSMKMALFSEVLATLQWHKPTLLEVSKQWPEFNHSLQVTRESAGDELSIAAYGSIESSRTKSRQQGIGTGILEFGHSELLALQSVFDCRVLTDPVSKQNLSLLHLLLRLLQLLGGDTCLDLLLSHGFPLLLQCSAVRDEPEIVTLVTNVFLELGSYHFAPSSTLTLSHFLIDTMAQTPRHQWHLRIRLLLFLQSFYFNHLLLLSSTMRYDLTLLVVDSLTDPQAEVRDLAADTLSGIIRCSPPGEQETFVEMLNDRFSSRLGKERELIDRHAAVLGLGALITAFPYTSPPPRWIPQILATLAVKAAGDSGVVGKSTKKILSDFKKTRQDTWHIDQTAFTQDQLDDLDGVLWRNYFA